MSENLFNSSHKATNEEYRKGYDAVFGKKEQEEEDEECQD